MSVKLPSLIRPPHLSHNSRSVSPKEMLKIKKVNYSYLDRDTSTIQLASIETARPRPSPSPETSQIKTGKILSLPNIKRSYAMSPDPIYKSFAKVDKPNQ